MGKGTGLIGNFKGKVGNTVGYKISASNTGNTQGIRVYQPIVRNPKTSAQAEQRAKLAPINATYRALKMVIDRGNEGLPYGSKSRLAWLKQAFKAQHMPWYVKGAQIISPVICQLTKGSLSGISLRLQDGMMLIQAMGVTTETKLDTIGNVSTAMKAAYPSLKDGDQLTFVSIDSQAIGMSADVFSIVIDPTNADAVSRFTAGINSFKYDNGQNCKVGAVIVSREGANGEHLRSTTALQADATFVSKAPYDATSKAAAIESYKSSASTNSDWAEESIQ